MMDCKEQLSLWVSGESVHIGNKPDGTCCPDFSCCQPQLQAPKEDRELFQELYLAEKHNEYERMLMMFLARAIPLMTDKKVYLGIEAGTAPILSRDTLAKIVKCFDELSAENKRLKEQNELYGNGRVSVTCPGCGIIIKAV